ncbi:MAG: hypothetical protein GXP37_01035, partial [Chloroflexi bacterium]|nr:hypothetical protein [Chloroflexota bacterium]
NGAYTVGSLPSGTYQIDVPASLPGLQRTTTAPKDYTLGVGEDYVDADFGYIAPTAVALADFSASHTGQGNLVQWQTASELDQTGFVIWRSSAENGTYKAVSGLISATNRPEGASYQWLDTLIDARTPAWYKIESVPDGALFGPVSVQPQPGDGGQILFIPLMIR